MLPRARHSRYEPLVVAITLMTLGGDAGGANLAALSQRAFEESFYVQAEAAARQHLARTQAATGPDSPQTAAALDLLVRCLPYVESARAPASLALAERAVDLKRRLYGPDDSRYALSLTWRAALLEVTGSQDEAREQYELALRITERARGRDDPQVALILGEMTPLLQSHGEHNRAIASAERALRILESATAPDSAQIAFTLNVLAISIFETGDYVRALASIDRAIAIREALYGNPDHPRVQGILNNRAVFLYRFGDDAAALETYRRVLDSLRRTLKDKNDLRIATTLLNVANLTAKMGELNAARQKYEEALEMLTRRGETKHEYFAECLLGLGTLQHELGDPTKALSYYQNALAVCADVLPVEHDLTSMTLRWLACLHYEQGRLDTANQMCLRALAIEKSFGDRPEVAETLALLGAIEAAAGEENNALDASLRAKFIASTHLRLMARGFVEREALLYAGKRPRGLDVPLRLAAAAADPQWTRRVWDVVIGSRGVVLDVMSARARAAALARDSETARLVEMLRDASARFMNLTVRGPGDDPQSHARLLQATRSERDALERDLTARSGDFRRDLVREQIGFETVAAHLPSQSALVAFVEYAADERPNPPLEAGALWKPRWSRGTPQLLAFVLGPNNDVAVVPLGPVNAIDTLVARWSREARRGARDGSAQADAAYVRRGAALRSAVWDRLQPHLGTARRVFLVPEGSLHKVNFAALPVASGRFLIDSGWRFQYLASERDLVPDEDAPPTGEGLLAVGAVDFVAPAPPSAQGTLQVTVAARTPTRGPSLPCGGLDDVQFPPLEETRVEIRRIAEIWARAARDATRIEFLTGADATETAFKKAAAGKRVLQIATHGFVLGLADCSSQNSGTRSIVPTGPGASRLHPSQLWLSGLVFADVAQRNEPVLAADDGVLTAQESALLNLHGVEWVVLSACDTGLGQTQNGEGVLGLRRAFQVAGARALIMSLWAVSDRATQNWMVRLYEARLISGLSTMDAVHEASLGALEARRQRGESTHPFYWGAFVAAGDWR